VGLCLAHRYPNRSSKKDGIITFVEVDWLPNEATCPDPGGRGLYIPHTDLHGTLFTLYRDWCQRHDIPAACTAYFASIIRSEYLHPVDGESPKLRMFAVNPWNKSCEGCTDLEARLQLAPSAADRKDVLNELRLHKAHVKAELRACLRLKMECAIGLLQPADQRAINLIIDVSARLCCKLLMFLDARYPYSSPPLPFFSHRGP